MPKMKYANGFIISIVSMLFTMSIGKSINQTEESADVISLNTTTMPSTEFQTQSLNLTTDKTATTEKLNNIENETISQDIRSNRIQEKPEMPGSVVDSLEHQESQQIPIYKASDENTGAGDEASLFFDDSPTREEDYAGGNYQNDDDFPLPDSSNVSPAK